MRTDIEIEIIRHFAHSGETIAVYVRKKRNIKMGLHVFVDKGNIKNMNN